MTSIAFKALILQGIIIFMSILCAIPAFAKGGDTMWVASDHQPHRQEAIVSAVDGNGNMIVAGYQNLTNNITDDDYWTVKYNSDGTVAWRAVYNRVGGSDQVKALAVDSANNVIVTGYVWNGTNNDIHTIKYAGTDGSVLWQDTYNGSANGKDIGTSITVDNTNNLIYVGGYTQNGSAEDYLLIKYDNKGAVPSNPPLQSIIYPGPNGGRNWINSVAICSGGVAVTGNSWNGTDLDFLTIKYSTDGTKLWDKRYTSPGTQPDTGRYVKCDQAGNVIVTGTATNSLDYDIHTEKYRAVDGERLWQVTYNGAYDDEPAGLYVDNAGDVYVTGYTWTLAGNNDFYTAKYSGATGEVLWSQVFDSGKGNADLATPTGIVVDEAVNGDVFVTGYTISSGNYDFQTIKYKKESGHLLWQSSFNGTANATDMTIGIGLAADGNVYVAGWSDMTTQLDGGTLTATGGSKSTVKNATKSWADNHWKDYFVMMTSGKNAGSFRKVLSNTVDTLTVSVDFGEAVIAGDGYYLYDKDDYDLYLIKYDKGSLNPPTNLVSNVISKDVNGKYTIGLTWEDNSSNENGFKIERKLGDQSDWSSATTFTVGPNVTSFEDAGLIENNYYYYRVKAYKGSDETYPCIPAHSLTFLMTYQNPTWKKIIDGGYNLEDDAKAIAVGPDDNPVVTGTSDSGDLGTFDFYTIKLNHSDLSEIWSHRYNSMQDETDHAKCLTVDNNNDVVVSGYSSLYYAPAQGNINSVYTIKYPAAGPPAVWGKQYNGPGAIDDRSTAVASASDGSSTVIVGYGKNSSQNEDIYVVKYLSDGTRAWAAIPYDGGRNDFPSSVAIDKDGNIVVAGYTQNSSGLPTDMNNYDFFIAKYNGNSSDGAMMWHDHYNVTGTGDNKAGGVAVDISGDIYMTGYATNAAGNEDFYTIKYNGANGNRIWEKAYDGPVHGNDRAVAIKVDPIIGSNPLDGNIVVLGTQLTGADDNDIKIIRYSQAGEVRWERTLQRPHVDDKAVAMAMDTAGYIYVAGNTGTQADEDIISLIYDYEGTLLGGSIFNGGNGFDEASSITVNHQGEAFVAGSSTNASRNLDYVVYKQKNNYILAPTPLLVNTQALNSQLQLTWRNNTPNTNIVIDRTLGPVTENSVWVNRASYTNPAPTTFMDTGLTGNTLYCYRIEAFSGTLPSRKAITCGTTTLPKPVLNPPTGVSTIQLTLTWGNFTGNIGYTVERKIGAGEWGVAPNGNLAANTTTYTDAGLTSGTQYTYRVTTNSPAGASPASDEKVVWTLPAAPILNLTTSWANRIDLFWNNVVGETGYRIERKTTGWIIITPVGVDSTSFSDTTVLPNTQYYYRIISINSSGESISSEVTIKTREVPVLMTTVANPAAGRIDLSWNDITNETAYTLQESSCQYANSDPNGYCNALFYADHWAWSGWVDISIPANTTSYSRTGLTSGYEYRYRIIATVPGNTTEISNYKGAWTWLTPAPTLTVSPASETSLALSWNDILGESIYEVWRKQGQAGTWGKVTDIGLNGTSYTNTGLLPQTEYCYQIKAVNTAVNADSLAPPPSPSNEVCLPTPLPAPVFNTPTVQSTTQLTVSWSTVTGSNSYELERCRYYDPNNPQNAPSYIDQAPATGYWVECTTVPVAFSQTSYISSGLTPGYTYRYHIRDLYGTTPVYYSAWSSYLLAGTLPPAPALTTATSPGGTQMTVNWNDVIGETSYKLVWKPRTGADCSTGTWNAPIVIGQNVTTYTQSGLTAATNYCYQLTASNSWGDSASSTALSQITALSAPVLNQPSGITTSSATITWGNLTGNTGYKVWRKVGSNGSYGLLTPLAADVATYTDGTLTAGTYYGYQLEALNSGGTSVRSNEQTFTSTPAATTITATPKSTSAIALTWPLRLGATNYKLERKLGTSGSWVEIVNSAATYAEDYCGSPSPTLGCQALTPASKTYQDQSLQSNTTYCYQVRGWNTTGGNAAYSSPERCVTTSSLPAVSLTAAAVNALTVKLDWIPETCNGSACEAPDGYEIEKAYGCKNLYSRIATVPATDTSFTQRSAIDPNTRNTYRVRSYHGIMESFDTGINPVSWAQQGIVYNNAGAIASNVTVPPIDIQGSNGISRIVAINGGVQLQTSSPGGGLAEKYNYTMLKTLDFTRIHDNFDVHVDFSLPDTPVTATQYHVYGRLHINFSTGNYAYVERSNSAYNASIIINGVWYSAGIATKDTIGKLRLSRMGDVISAYAWTGGQWVLIKEMPGFTTAVANYANLTQYVQRNEATTLKINLDNYEATTQRPAYSNEATATTPPFSLGANTCK